MGHMAWPMATNPCVYSSKPVCISCVTDKTRPLIRRVKGLISVHNMCFLAVYQCNISPC